MDAWYSTLCVREYKLKYTWVFLKDTFLLSRWSIHAYNIYWRSCKYSYHRGQLYVQKNCKRTSREKDSFHGQFLRTVVLSSFFFSPKINDSGKRKWRISFQVKVVGKQAHWVYKAELWKNTQTQEVSTKKKYKHVKPRWHWSIHVRGRISPPIRHESDG